jgi:signal transduction histidine kinase
MNRLARAYNDLTLATQAGLACAVVTLAVGAAAWWASGRAPAATWAAATAGAGSALAASLVVARAARGLLSTGAAARLLARDGPSEDHDLPHIDTSREFLETSASLRRMVEAGRRRERALESQLVALGNRLEHRTRQLTTLQDLSIGLAGTSDMHELVDEALKALEQTLEYASASLWARDLPPQADQVVLLGYRVRADVGTVVRDDLTGLPLSRANMQRYEQIERAGEPVIENQVRQTLLSWLWTLVTDDSRSSSLYQQSRSCMGVPLKFREQVLGVMRVDHEEEGYFDSERSRLLTAVGSQAALAMRHAQLLAVERDMAVIAERTRIARDLHDAVSQTLFASNLIAGALARMAERDGAIPAETLASQLKSLERLNRGALAEMRLLMFELRGDTTQDVPLGELLHHAIEALSCRGEIVVDKKIAKRDRLPPDAKLEVYRIAQEALSNVVRHSGARHVSVEWRTQPAGRAVLRIADDGAGFDPDTRVPGHFGLDNMRHRAERIGARFELASRPGQGTELVVDIADGTHV